MNEVSDVLRNIDHALDRAKKARKRLGDEEEVHNARLALAEAITSLTHTRKRLQRDAYFDGDALRLM